MAFNNFPYTDAHELNLDWIIKKQKATAIEAEEALKTANEAESKVDNFIENLDVTEAVNDKLDEMYEDGDFQDMFDRYQKLTGDVIIISASFGKEQPRGNAYETIVPFTIQCKNRIETYTNRKCYWNAIGAKGFHNDGFLDVLQALENTVTDPNKVDLIMVAGGGNDITVLPDGATISKGDIQEGMEHFMTYVKAHYPNAVVRFAWLTWTRVFLSYRPVRDIIKVIGWYKELCGKVGIGYCANSEYIYHQYYEDWFLGDNYHPSTTGSTHIADGIMDCILTGSCSIYRKEIVEANAFITSESAQFTINSVVPFQVIQNNDVTTISPMVRPVNPAVKTTHYAGFYQVSEDYNMPGYFRFHSNLFKLLTPIEELIPVPVNVLALTVAGDTLSNKDMFSGTAGFSATYLYMGAVRSGLYQIGTGGSAVYTDDWFYFPDTITIPTSIA